MARYARIFSAGKRDQVPRPLNEMSDKVEKDAVKDIADSILRDIQVNTISTPAQEARFWRKWSRKMRRPSRKTTEKFFGNGMKRIANFAIDNFERRRSVSLGEFARNKPSTLRAKAGRFGSLRIRGAKIRQRGGGGRAAVGVASGTMARTYRLKSKLIRYGRGFAIFGEKIDKLSS